MATSSGIYVLGQDFGLGQINWFFNMEREQSSWIFNSFGVQTIIRLNCHGPFLDFILSSFLFNLLIRLQSPEKVLEGGGYCEHCKTYFLDVILTSPEAHKVILKPTVLKVSNTWEKCYSSVFLPTSP